MEEQNKTQLPEITKEQAEKYIEEIFEEYGRPILNEELAEGLIKKTGYKITKSFISYNIPDIILNHLVTIIFGDYSTKFYYPTIYFNKLLIKFIDNTGSYHNTIYLIEDFIKYLIDTFRLRDVYRNLIDFNINKKIHLVSINYKSGIDLHHYFADLIKKYENKFYVTAEEGFYIIKTINQADILRQEKIIIDGVFSSLKSNKKIKLSELIFELNLNSEIDFRPINSERILKIINQYSNDFNFDSQTKIIFLKSDEEILEAMKNYFEEKTETITSFIEKGAEPGILAVIFSGKNFPLEEAANYINTRPIILLDNITYNNDLKVYFNLNNKRVEDTNANDLKYLKALLPKDTDYNNWLNENCIVSFFPISKERIQTLMPKVIKHFSPVLNLNRNPNNLFEFTIKQKVEEYLKNLNG